MEEPLERLASGASDASVARLVGIDIAPDVSQRMGTFGLLRQFAALDAVGNSPAPDLSSLSSHAAVFAVGSEEYAQIASPGGPIVCEWIRGTESENEDEPRASGVFWPIEKLTAGVERSAFDEVLARQASARRDRLMKVVASIQADESTSSRSVHGARASGEGPSASDSQPSSQEHRLHAQPMPDSIPYIQFNKAEGLLDDPRGAFQRLGAEQLAKMVSGELAAGLAPGSLLNSALGGAAGMVTSYLTAKLLGSLFTLDDNASTMEYVEGMVAPKLLQAYLLGDLSHVAKLGFEDPGPDSYRYEDAALRVGDKDEYGNAIAGVGCPSVLIEGAAAARDGDPLIPSGSPKGKECSRGAKTVMIGGQRAARADVVCPGYGTISADANGRFLKGATKTFIGGTVGSADPNYIPPPPPEWTPESTGIKRPSSSAPNGSGYPQLTPDMLKDKPPQDPGMYWDPAMGEWRMFHPQHGWSGTPLEVASSGFRFGWWPENTERASHNSNEGFIYTALNPSPYLWQLGSPEWPGAGNAGTWWVPDSLFGIDMSALYTGHDWATSYRTKSSDPSVIWKDFVDIEVAAFKHGIAWMPLQWPMQVIYSSATSSHTIIGYFRNGLSALDQELGFPEWNE